MKKAVFLFFIIFYTCLFSQNIDREITDRYVKENIAVFEIEDVSTEYRKDLGKKVTTLIENSLTRMNRFNIVDRANLDKYLKEMELQLTGITEEQVIEVGKIYGYSKAITGRITSANVTFDYDIESGSGNIYANVDLVLQIVDVETTKILYSSKISGSAYYSINRYPSMALREAALDEACNDLAIQVESKMKNVFKIILKISDIKDGNVILFAGSEHGINKNTRFKVYSKSEDMVLPSGNVIEGEYKEKGTLRIKDLGREYSIAKISRGNDIKAGDIARETHIGNFLVGFNINYSAYKMKSLQKTYQSATNNGQLNINLNKNDFALGMHLRVGYDNNLFSPNLSFGLLFGDFFKTSYGIDIRFNFDINVNIYKEVVRFVFIPHIGLGLTFTDIGNVSGGDYYIDANTSIPNESKISSRDIFFGLGAMAVIQYNIKDTLGFNFGIGYRLYTKPINLGTYYDGNSFALPEKIKTVNLTGFDFMIGIYGLL